MSCGSCARWKRVPSLTFGFCVYPQLVGGRLQWSASKQPYWFDRARSGQLMTHATHGGGCAAYHPRRTP